MRYNILKSHLHPAFDKYGNRELAEGKNSYRVEWEIVGRCSSLAQAVILCAAAKFDAMNEGVE